MERKHLFTRIHLIALPTIIAMTLGSCVTGVSREEAASAYYDLGNAYFELLRYDDAVRAYSRAMDLDPTIIQAGYNLARVYIETGRLDEGIDVLEDLLANDPENTSVRSTLAWAQYRRGDFDEAIEGYKRVLEKIGNDQNALYNVAVISWKLGDIDQAIEYFELYHEQNPVTDTLEILGRLYSEEGNTAPAISRFEEYASSVTPSVDVLLIMADLYEQTEAYGKAASMYTEALDRDSSRAVARFSYARILLEKIEDYSTGMDQLKIAIDSGFSDEEKLQALLDNSRSYYADELRDLLQSIESDKSEADAEG